MRAYVLSLSVGILVGVIYALLNVRSPAPPVVALIGLLGILLGERLVPITKRLISDKMSRDARRTTMCTIAPCIATLLRRPIGALCQTASAQASGARSAALASPSN